MKKILLTLLCLIGIFNIKAQTTITIGSASIMNATTESSPINIFFRSNHCQILYTAAELNAAGWVGQGAIDKLGFNIAGSPLYGLPNYCIKLKNTTATDVATDDAVSLSTVYTSTMYYPTAGGFELLTLDNVFIWDGSSNLLVDVCFDQVSPTYDQSGLVYLYNYTSGVTEYSFTRNDGAPQCGVPTSTTNVLANPTYKPQLQLSMYSLTPCSGSPSAGDAVSTFTNVCANTPFSLGLINVSLGGGLEYQWQSSPNGTAWTNIGTVQYGYTYPVSSISSTTYYQCITTCSISALSSTSTPVVVNLNPLINCYCTPNYSWTCTNDNFTDFSLSNIISQPTACDPSGYSDSTSSNYTIINLNAASTYTLLANAVVSGFYGDAAMGAWIDYNQNSIFEPAEFTSLGFGPSGTYSNTLTVPLSSPSGIVRMRLKLDEYYAGSSTILDPCYNNNGAYNGQILDYKVNIIAAPACSGAPNAGDATSTETAVCQNKNFVLDLTNNSISSNITYQWQSSTDNIIWSNLGTLQSTILYSVATQSISTYYRCVSTCTTSAPISSTSTPVMVTQNLPTACYCTPDFINCSNGAIMTNVTIASVSYTPACQAGDNYFDITSNPTYSLSLTANQSYNISIDISSSFPMGYVGAWIDYNQNGIFEDVTEYISIGNIDNGNITIPFTVPFTAIGGSTRLRLKMESVNGSFQGLNSCMANSFDGQTVDYLVNITPSSPCSGTPNAGDATSGVSSICTNTSFSLDLANNDLTSNMSYQWQSSIDNVNWTNIGSSQTFVPYTITSQSVTSYYRCLVTCTTSALTATSTAWTVSQNAVTACYCIPETANCMSGDEINYVAFATMTNTSSCDGTNGYSDYTGSVAASTVTAGQTYTLTTRLGSTFGEHVYTWIDYDQNGIFDSSEFTDLGSNSGNDTISGGVTISLTALPGNTRIRVRNFRGINLGANDACLSPFGGARTHQLSSILTGGAFGETEDYLITILPPDCSVINIPPTITLSGILDICPGNATTLDLATPLQAATGLTYQWKYYNGTAYVNQGTASSSSNLNISPSSNTSYYCEVLCNGNPVKNTDTVLVKVQTITASPVTTSITCNGLCNGSAAINASSFGSTLTYTWSPSGGGAAVASTLCAGVYSVTITNPTGCVITETISITEPAALIAASSQTNISCYGLTDGIATVTVSGGVSPLTFSWLPTGGSALTANNLTVGNYTFNVSDGNGCTSNETITISQPAIFSSSITASASSICEQLEDTITSTIIGGTTPYSYNWIELPSSSVSTNPNYTYTTSVGTKSYNLSVTDINGCIATSNTVAIIVNPSSNFSGNVTTSGSAPVAGRVVLFKYLPFYTKFDSVAGQNIGGAGNFLFTSFTSGIYIIKAIPTATNMQIAYGADPGDTAVAWKDAKQIIHGCAVNDIQNIFVPAMLTFTASGTGLLSGKITEGVGYDSTLRVADGYKPLVPGGPIGGIIVKGGKNPGGQMFVQTITDVNGNYSLSGLPPNGNGESYFILVDIPGLDTNNTYHRVISNSTSTFSGLDFVVDSAKINPVPSSVISVHDISAIENEIKVFPNPASSNVSIQYNLKNSALVKIELFDMLGKSVKMLMSETKQGMEMHKKTWQIDDIGAGLYFIKMTINGSESLIKLSVTN